MVLVRPSAAEIVLNHLVGPSEVPGGSASNISIASTFVTALKGGPLRFSMADYSKCYQIQGPLKGFRSRKSLPILLIWKFRQRRFDSNCCFSYCLLGQKNIIRLYVEFVCFDLVFSCLDASQRTVTGQLTLVKEILRKRSGKTLFQADRVKFTITCNGT